MVLEVHTKYLHTYIRKYDLERAPTFSKVEFFDTFKSRNFVNLWKPNSLDCLVFGVFRISQTDLMIPTYQENLISIRRITSTEFGTDQDRKLQYFLGYGRQI